MWPRLLTVLPAVVILCIVACGDDDAGVSSSAGGSSSAGIGGDPPTDAAATGVGGGVDPNVTITKGPSCSSATNCTLTFSGSAFDGYDGKTLQWGLLEAGSLAFQTSGTIEAGAFSFNEAVLGKGRTFFLQYWIDDNDNMTCDSPPTDPVWRIDLSTIYQDLSVEVVFSQQSFNELGCMGF
jgi:hypothetical protein